MEKKSRKKYPFLLNNHVEFTLNYRKIADYDDFGNFWNFLFENLEMNFYKLTKFQLWGVILVVEQDVISLFLWLSVNWLNWHLPPTRPWSQFRNYVSFSIIHLIFQITCYVSTTMDKESVILWSLRNCSIQSKFENITISSIRSQVHKQTKTYLQTIYR